MASDRTSRKHLLGRDEPRRVQEIDVPDLGIHGRIKTYDGIWFGDDPEAVDPPSEAEAEPKFGCTPEQIAVREKVWKAAQGGDGVALDEAEVANLWQSILNTASVPRDDPLSGANCGLCGATADNFHVPDDLWERVGLGSVQACFKCFRIAAFHAGADNDAPWEVRLG